MAPPKKKAEKMSLGDFLGDQTLGSWADEMEDTPLGTGTGGGGGGAYKPGGGGGFGGSGGGFGPSGGGFARDALPLPTKPPFTAHLGNLSFDATEGDIGDFFGDCQVTNVRIVEDKLEMKPKGFGYVEFGSLDGLKKALELSGTQFQGRNIRVSVAEPPKDRADQKDMSDWTRKGPLPDLPGAGRRVSERGGFGDRSGGGGGSGGGFGGDRAGGFERGRNFEPAGSDAGSERGERRRPPPFEGDGKVRDFGNWERKGPLSPVPGAAPPSRDGGRTRTYDGPREQRQSPAAGWGEGRTGAPAEGGSQDGSRPPRREFQDRPQYDRQPTAPELDNQWRTKMRPDAAAKSPTSTPDASTPSSPAPQPAAPAGRPRLNLAKRTVSEAVPAPITSASESKSNPFGAARPIDTATREKEIEEKREIAIREKKEADDKAREEKRAKDTADRAARASVPPTPTTEAPRDRDLEEKSAASYEILQRGEDDAENAEEGAAVDAFANGEIVEDKAVKPQEVVRDTPKAEGAGAWRRKGAPAAEPTESTTETVEDDGWSTVTKPKATKTTRGGPPARGGRGGPPTRAIAS